MALPLLQFTPLLVPKPWGGRRLADLGRDLPADVPIGESWDVADLPHADTVADPVTRVAAGPLAGTSLHELMQRDADALLGATDVPDGRFPLLVKTLDARQHLSVQVHPCPQQAVDPSIHLKTESWVVLQAEPDASVMIGLEDGVTPEVVRESLGTPRLAKLLRHVPARVGDVHHLPAGLVHALGAGVVVAEVQTPSDTTFRLYDWTQEYGRDPRELHLEDGWQAIEQSWEANVADDPPPPAGSRVVETPHYCVDRHVLAPGEVVPRRPGQLSVVYLVSGRLLGATLALQTAPGSVVVVPAACEDDLRTDATSTVLVFSLP